jgi:hypothetical protein
VEELIVCIKKIAIDCYICSVVLLMDFLHQARMVVGRGEAERGLAIKGVYTCKGRELHPQLFFLPTSYLVLPPSPLFRQLYQSTEGRVRESRGSRKS